MTETSSENYGGKNQQQQTTTKCHDQDLGLNMLLPSRSKENAEELNEKNRVNSSS